LFERANWRRALCESLTATLLRPRPWSVTVAVPAVLFALPLTSTARSFTVTARSLVTVATRRPDLTSFARVVFPTVTLTFGSEPPPPGFSPPPEPGGWPPPPPPSGGGCGGGWNAGVEAGLHVAVAASASTIP